MHRVLLPITIFLIIFATGLMAQDSSVEFFEKADRFFTKYVHNGKVNYPSLKNNSYQLKELIDLIAKFNLENLPGTESKKAFWINAYNLLVINSVIENFPIGSPRAVAGFFESKKHNAAGELLTLNELEQSKLLKKYGDPRLHFVLVCGAVSCPKIINSAYRSNSLETQLDQRTRITLNNHFYVRVDDLSQKVRVSEIFKWYKNEFTADGKTLIQFINQYRKDKISENLSVSYIAYNWALNGAYPKGASGYSEFSDENLRKYTPSSLLLPGQFEIKQFNNLYTQTAFFNDDGDKQELGERQDFFTSANSFIYGYRNNINVGLGLFFKAFRKDREAASPFALFKFSNFVHDRDVLSHIAPLVKFIPFPNLPKFSLQTTLLIPLEGDLDGSDSNGKPFVDFDGIQWWMQFFYDRSLNNDFLLYLETGLFFRFGSPSEDFYTPTKAILNYYTSERWTMYLLTELTPFWSGNSVSSFFWQGGVGGKYLASPNFEVELLYTNFFIGKNQGAGVTYNLGLRVIR